MTSNCESMPDLLIIGGGAAGLFAGIHAGRAGHRVVILEGARKVGAKILVAGGGRCNVTHHHVDERAFAGASAPAIRKVLRRFTADDTVDFFAAEGVSLKREDTGKLFPTTDDARTVLRALLHALRETGAELRHPRRVDQVTHDGDGFVARGEWGELRAPRLLLATGGKALPKSGSDGLGYDFARTLGHSVNPDIHPALVPLILPGDHPLRTLSGISLPATVRITRPSGKILSSFTNSLLFTHFGLSGPAALDISRYWRAAWLEDPAVEFRLAVLPDLPAEELDARWRAEQATTVIAALRRDLPERCARTVSTLANVNPEVRLGQLGRDDRRRLVETCTNLLLPIEGDRGFTHAEVTMGGVPLSEVRLETMESRLRPGLFLAGEILDVDGRIGGFNFQWAWASGYLVGTSLD